MASEKIMNFVEEIKKLSVLELSELVDAIQDKFFSYFFRKNQTFLA